MAYELRVMDWSSYGGSADRVCRDCGVVAYEKPKIVVGSVAAWQGRILLCRRAIEPRRGFWTLPAGFLELQETAAAGARREAREEARAELESAQLLAIYSIPRIAQNQLLFLPLLPQPDLAVGKRKSCGEGTRGAV